MSDHPNSDSNKAAPARLLTVKQILKNPTYGWVTHSYLRHVIFHAEDRFGSGGIGLPGNGLAPAIIRIGRKVLLDMDEFDRWVEMHRMAPVRPDAELHCNTRHIGESEGNTDKEECK